MSGTDRQGPIWRMTGGRRLTPAPFLVAGIVNLTPDSFSDGGRFSGEEAGLARVRQVLEEGAHMVDLGAESTRPGARDIGHDEEWRRLAPVLAKTLELRRAPGGAPDPQGASALSGDLPFAVSVDTFRAATAARALALHEKLASCPPVDVINDISGASFDPDMAGVLACRKPGYVLCHSPARPDVMQKDPRYRDVAEELLAWFEERMNALVRAGLPEECISLDPGIGFGKTLDHTLALFAAIPRFAALGRPLYFGISRKSFLGALGGLPVVRRDGPTQAALALLARAGVQIHRVHQVAESLATLRLARAFAAGEGAMDL